MPVVSPVILCGGSGSRLWPLSRSGFPKQFLSLTGRETLFQQALARLIGVADTNIKLTAPYVVSNEAHRFLVTEQMRESGVEPASVLLEPVGRNTAPALTLAALAAREAGDDPVLVVTPSDHAITDETAFLTAVRRAVTHAAEGAFVILGVTPDRPETGFGYVRAQARADSADESVSAVERFVEKPNASDAQKYLDEGGYFWNAGMFVVRASVWLQALRAFRPDIADAVNAAWQQRTRDGAFLRPDRDAFLEVPGESIDYAVIERCPGSEFPIKMVALDAGWSDLGAWDAVWDALKKDESGNAHVGDVILERTRNTLVHATSRLVTVVGGEDLVVVETADAVLVTHKNECQRVKKIVETLGHGNRGERDLHRKVYRPWGWYDSVDEGDRFKVKRIQVKPGASLSLQKHRHRAEHWVVVSGVADVVCGDKVSRLTENQSTYIPVGEVHRLTNPGDTPLEVVEVQSGGYLGEDDIVRLEDIYGRKENH
ncbi:mannose-1-phosphate guanyltransferase [Pandoraea morbifera]|uniref:mannose-1-phosphate guanylyltransferase n=2 Tax=Pandoraea morbifera TaxID=2508300 RepID=A0A5E4X716_9BURK|nr:mannose-1-phosphate guanylyltransferase/mannose-6-phosphate isomerase [Pandoraea morbifera]VVE31925.1 mannose-1-phosphate guanyltransferase [Pandoraea morbifera]